MAFLKKRKVNGEYYWSIVESFRLDGKVKQKTIENLGNSQNAIEILKTRHQDKEYLLKILETCNLLNSLQPVHVQPCRTTDLDKWIAERHYLQSTPAGARLRLWILNDKREIIGAMMWGRPVARLIDQKSILELTRMYLIDETIPFAESKALSLARKYIRKHMPEIKGVLAYSSKGNGHEGTIYQADNWFMLGTSSPSTKRWSNRKGRSDRDLSEKIRWCRTP